MALPLPKVVYDVAPGGGIVTGMSGANALTKSALENKIAQAQAQYAPYQAYGNAFLTNQEAQWVPYKYQMQALSNSLLWMAAQNNPALMSQIKSMMSNPLQSIGQGQSINVPPPNMAPQGNGLYSLLLSKLLSGGNNSGGTSQSNMPANTNALAPTASSSVPNVNAMTNKEAIEYANSHQQGSGAFPVTNPTVGYNTPAVNAANQVSGQAGLSGTNPYSAAEASSDAAKAAVAGQTAAQTEQQSARSKQISTQSQIATTALKSLEAWSRNYDKSKYKGQFIGNKAEEIPTLPGGTIAPEQLANRYGSQFLTDLSGLGDTPAGKTDEGRELIAAGKPDLSLEPDAKKELYEQFKAKLHRMITLRNFANDFYKNNPGATDEQAVAMMNAYNNYAPSYDYKNGKLLPKNEKKFKDFTSKEALQSYIQNGDYNPYENKAKQTNEEATQPSGKITNTQTIGKDKFVSFDNGKNWWRQK